MRSKLEPESSSRTWSVRRYVRRSHSGTAAASSGPRVVRRRRYADRRAVGGGAAIAVVVATWTAPPAHAEDTVTYEVFSHVVPVVKRIDYRDVNGRHSLHGVALPWTITVPVGNAFDPWDNGAEVRVDWRPDFRTAATVGRVLQGQFVTVRVLLGDRVLCENTLDVGNVTCFGNIPHRPDTTASHDQGPLFPPPETFRP